MRKGQQNGSHFAHESPDGNWSTRNYNSGTNIQCKKISIILPRQAVTFTLISLEMKGQAWRKYLFLLGTSLNYHKTLDAYWFIGLSCTLSKALLYSHMDKW